MSLPSAGLNLRDITTLVGPVLALVGTLVVAFLGYRQWKKQQDSVRYGTFLAERQAAYKELWQKLEAVHLSIRSDKFSQEHFNDLVRTANTHLIKSGLHLDSGEDKRVNEYLAALGDLGRLLSETAESESKTKAQESLSLTTTIPEDVMTRIAGLQRAYRLVDERREDLITHFRLILGAHLFE